MLIKKLMRETGFETITDSLVNSNKFEFPGGDSSNTYFNYPSGWYISPTETGIGSENNNNQNQFDLSNVTQILDEAPQNGSPQTIYLRSNYGDEGRVNDIVKELQSFKHFWSSVESKLMNMEEAIICYSKGQITGDKGGTTERFITDLLK